MSGLHTGEKQGEIMDKSRSLVGASLLWVACAGSTPQPHSASDGASPVSKRKQSELNSVAEEIKYESGDVLSGAAKGMAYDECMDSLACTYCRKVDGWWMMQRCD
jgi:hypothetical protein